jgi:putative hydrolase of the HAD superfamily
MTTLPTKAVFFDALGTLIELEPPWPRLAAELGIEPDQAVVDALRLEMAYYREHAHEAVDEPALAALRARCAALLSTELGREVTVEALMASIRFRAFADSAPALKRLGGRGLKLVCVSNWDVSLEPVLERCGLLELLDGAISSAAAGASKPAPAIFTAALAIAGCAPAEALHVGDTPEEDVAGARAAGIEAVLLDRDGGGEVASLAELEAHLRP